jgi:sialidase-1
VIVAPNADVLAFCEGRKDGGGFTGNIDIVMKRSTDGGKSWGPLRTIADDGPNTLGYPVPVVERQTRTIWLLMTRSRGDETETQIVAGTSKERTRVFVMSSRDNGVTWSRPVDISAATRRPEWTWYGLGSGIGIQLRSGRLVIPAYHNIEKTREFSSHVLYSDDRGATWQLGGDVGGQTGECQVAERRDGSLYLNARNQRGQNWSIVPLGAGPKPEGQEYNQRLVASSSDAGKTWGKVGPDGGLHEPICQGMVYVWPELQPAQKPLWLFSNPAGPGRRNLTLRLSRDEGRSWPVARKLQEGTSEYSCLTRLPDGAIGCIYDRWEDKNYRVYWARVPLSWLLAL